MLTPKNWKKDSAKCFLQCKQRCAVCSPSCTNLPQAKSSLLMLHISGRFCQAEKVQLKYKLIRLAESTNILTLPRFSAFVNAATGQGGSFSILYEVSMELARAEKCHMGREGKCMKHSSSLPPSKPSRRLCCRILEKCVCKK